MIRALRSMIGQDEGATLVEYALLIGLVAIVAWGGAYEIGRSLDRTFDQARNVFRDH